MIYHISHSLTVTELIGMHIKCRTFVHVQL